MSHNLKLIWWLVLAGAILVGCVSAAVDETFPTPPSGNLTLTSASFVDGEMLADKYTFSLAGQCAGDNISPQLGWGNDPAGTQSYAILMQDPDGGNWTHWLLFNLQPGVRSLPEAAGGPQVGLRGRNDFGELGYGGPCPPGGTHRYMITLYALDGLLPLQEGASGADFLQAVRGHILAQASLTGRRSR